MKGLILVLLVSSVVGYKSPVYKQEEWNNRAENAEPNDEQFYEGFFATRIDHFQPLNQTMTRFVGF